MTAIFRHNFRDSTKQHINIFSQTLTKDVGKGDFDECFEEWYEQNKKIFTSEESYLKENGYDGDIKQKTYIAIRYYIMKKSDSPKKKQAKKRRKYITINKAILDVMDSHITSIILNTPIKPAECFRRFLNDNTHGEIIEACKQSILNGENSITENEIDSKIKKTYKNRYFLIQKKIREGDIDDLEVDSGDNDE